MQINRKYFEKGLNVVSPYFTTPLYNLSDIVRRFNQKVQPSCLNTRSVQKSKFTILSS